jgi:RHS repeat-associated protein
VAQRLGNGPVLLSSHVYDAYGAGQSTPAVANEPFGYGAQWGYYTDGETGLVALTYRYYDAGTGRFLNRDPIGYAGGINLYGYVENNPVDGIDPDGLNRFVDWGRDWKKIFNILNIWFGTNKPIPDVKRPPRPIPHITPKDPPTPAAPPVQRGVQRTPCPKPPMKIGTPRSGFTGPIRGRSGGFRGSGGAMGAIDTIGTGLGVGAELATHTIRHKKRIDQAQGIADNPYGASDPEY